MVVPGLELKGFNIIDLTPRPSPNRSVTGMCVKNTPRMSLPKIGSKSSFGITSANLFLIVLGGTKEHTVG